MRAVNFSLAAGAFFLLAGCTTDNPTSLAANDPYEPMNRKIFEMNQATDRAIIKPVAEAYVEVVPEEARNGVHNFIVNLRLPITFANDVLQGEFERGGETVARFGINSTVGVAGLFDVASDWGIPFHTEDFGQTLAAWGVDEGPYLVVPFYGPDPPRDLTGQVVDVFLDPFTYVNLREHIWWSAGEEVVRAVDLRSRNLQSLEDIERSSVDLYASERSLYRQHRNAEIRNGKPDMENLPNL
jgi:phospholipid-binding lipoprotein MlaA